MTSQSDYWTWSETHNDHYHQEWKDGNWHTTWAKQSQGPQRQPRRRDSGHQPPVGENAHTGLGDAGPGADEEVDSVVSMSESGVPTNAILGTDGTEEKLDPSYYVRSNPKRFFKQGRVFAVLHSEPYGETAPPARDRDNVSQVIHGGLVYTNIRRFVVVKEKKGFCYACPISTYGGRGALKPGLNQRAHAAIYVVGTHPTYLHREAIVKSPIAIIPANPKIHLYDASRINFAKHYPIEHNVKVKDIGQVCPEYMTTLIAHYKDED